MSRLIQNLIGNIKKQYCYFTRMNGWNQLWNIENVINSGLCWGTNFYVYKNIWILTMIIFAEWPKRVVVMQVFCKLKFFRSLVTDRRRTLGVYYKKLNCKMPNLFLFLAHLWNYLYPSFIHLYFTDLWYIFTHLCYISTHLWCVFTHRWDIFGTFDDLTQHMM